MFKMGDGSEVNVTENKGLSFSPQPTGYLLSGFGLLALLAGLLLATWYGQVTIVILVGMVLSASGLSKLQSCFSLVGVSCQHLRSERRVFPGESVELSLRIINRKLLLLPWIKMDDALPC
jgi:hypothetical protein